MTRVKPVPREELGEFSDMFAWYEETLGVVPNSFFALANKPELLRAFTGLMRQVWSPGKVSGQLKALVALMASTAAGCRYCQAHEVGRAVREGAGAEKLAAVWDFEHSDVFTDAERAALRLARDAAQVPNAVTDEVFDDVRRHFDDEAIVEIMAVVAAFGFLNRWNDTLATPLEDLPIEEATEMLGPVGWSPGKHAPEKE